MFQLDLKEPVIRNPADRVERDDLGAIASPRVRGEGCVGLDRPRQQAQRARVRGRLRTSLFRIGPLPRTADAVSASPRTAGRGDVRASSCRPDTEPFARRSYDRLQVLRATCGLSLW